MESPWILTESGTLFAVYCLLIIELVILYAGLVAFRYFFNRFRQRGPLILKDASFGLPSNLKNRRSTNPVAFSKKADVVEFFTWNTNWQTKYQGSAVSV